MDYLSTSLGDYLDNFDPDFLISGEETSSCFKPGLKLQQVIKDPMKSCNFSDDAVFLQSENVSGSSIFQSTIPLTNEIIGNYNFQIKLGTQAKRVANPDWVYKNDKLYIKASNVCPIVFSVLPSLPSSCSIKVTPIFKDQAHIRDIVRCCPNHSVMDASTNGYSAASHFIRCDNHNVSYDECPLTGRFFFTVPFVPTQQDPTTKILSTHELFSFVCNNSCNGLDRRAIQIVFELIKGETVIGRRLMEVRVCACPGRDSTIDESQKQMFRKKRRCQSATEPPRYSLRGEVSPPAPPVVDVNPEAPARKKKAGENFYLKINGRQNFVIMERIAKALELFTTMEKRFFSKNFPFQALGQISTNNHNQSPEYVEPDSTLYRHSPSQTSTHSPLPSPTTGPRWADNMYSVSNQKSSTQTLSFSTRPSSQNTNSVS